MSVHTLGGVHKALYKIPQKTGTELSYFLEYVMSGQIADQKCSAYFFCTFSSHCMARHGMATHGLTEGLRGTVPPPRSGMNVPPHTRSLESILDNYTAGMSIMKVI